METIERKTDKDLLRKIIFIALIALFALLFLQSFGEKPSSQKADQLNMTVSTNDFGEVRLDWNGSKNDLVTYAVIRDESCVGITNKTNFIESAKAGKHKYTVLPTTLYIGKTESINVKPNKNSLKIKVQGKKLVFQGKTAKEADGYELVKNNSEKKVTDKKTITAEGEPYTTSTYKVRAFKEDTATGKKIYTEPVEKKVFITDYNVASAIEYVHTYYQNYNPEYNNFNPQGGDCANFVSQCLKAGGVTETDGWYYINGSHSASWTACNSMYDYFSSSHRVVTNPSQADIDTGDIVMRADFSHVVLCTGKTETGFPLISAHNSNHIDYPLYGELSSWIVIKMSESVDTNATVQ